MYKCPICGKSENRRGNAFTDVSNVVGHIDGSHDEDHKNVSGDELLEEIEATKQTDTESTPDRDGDRDEAPRAEATEPNEPINDIPEAQETDIEPPQEPADTSNLVPAEQVQEVAENAERAGYEAGLDDGYQAAEHEQPETDQTTDENTLEPDSRATCPECGEPMFTGEELETILNERAKTDKAARKFIKANEGAAPDRACREIYQCGYYVENGEPKRFDTPGGGWVKKLVTVGGTAAAGAIGLAAIAGNDDETSPWDRA